MFVVTLFIMAIVYEHRRLDNDKLFYVGIGKTVSRAKSKKGRNGYWTNYVNKYGFVYNIIYKDLSWDEACKIEIELIKHYGRVDLGTGILLNMTDGGDGNNNFSPEVIQRISEKLKGRFVGELHPCFGKSWGSHTENFKEYMSERMSGENGPLFGLKGENHPCFGLKKTEEQCKEISERQKGDKNHMFGKCGKLHFAYGVPRTDEVKQKISNSKTGIPMEELVKEKIRIANTGKIHKKETKIKIGEAQIGEKNHMFGKSGDQFSFSKLKKEDVIWIRNHFIKGDLLYGQRAMSKKFNVSKTTIRDIINRKLWKNI